MYACRILEIKRSTYNMVWQRQVTKYYTNLNKINNTYLPSVFLCWTKTDRDLLNKQFQTRRAYYIGNPNLFKPRSNFKFTEGVNYVLLILSVDLPDWLDEFILFLNERDIGCIVKEHPVNKIKKKLPNNFSDKNLFIKDNLSVNSLLSPNCVGCVTEWSAGILEVMDSGIKCYTIGQSGLFCLNLYYNIVNCLDIKIFKESWELEPFCNYTLNPLTSLEQKNYS